MSNEKIEEFRAVCRKQSADWFVNNVFSPFITKCKEAGMSEQEAYDEFNAQWRSATHRMNGW